MGDLYTDGFEIVYACSGLAVSQLIQDRYGSYADWDDGQFRRVEYGTIIPFEFGPLFREELLELVEKHIDTDAAFIADAEYGDYYRFVEDGLKLLESA